VNINVIYNWVFHLLSKFHYSISDRELAFDCHW